MQQQIIILVKGGSGTSLWVDVLKTTGITGDDG